jgi:hypothetical protein
MINKVPTDRQERLTSFLQAVEAAQQLQDDILRYGLAAADLYCEDVDSDWLERWGDDDEEDKIFVGSFISFLSSNDSVALQVRRQLKDKSLQDIAAQLETCLSLTEEQERIFAVKSLLVDNVAPRDRSADVDNDVDEVDLLDLAEELVEKLGGIVSDNSP